LDNLIKMIRPPPSAARMGTGRGARNPGTAMGRPPLGTAMNPMTARPGSRGGAALGGALNAQIQVSDRPVTRQGLGGMKTHAQGPQRQVQDKSYWLGVLRGKINELSNEIAKLNKEINQFNQENASYLTYEKRAETLAGEIKELQGTLADYNCIVDKLNTNAGFEDLEEDYQTLKAQNDRDTKGLDDLFAQRKDKDHQLKQIDLEMDQERRMTESLVADMSSTQREKYAMLKNRNMAIQSEIESKQQELDQLNERIDELEQEISQSPVKQEAVTLYEKIDELEEKKQSLEDEMKRKDTPAEEREKLLKQVKEDNQEIARMENRMNELKERLEKVQDENRQLDMDLEEHHGERTAKYKELKKRDESMQEFLDTFEESKAAEEEKMKVLGGNVVQLLEKISRATVQTKHMPSMSEFKQIKDDYKFKETEMIKSKETSLSLDQEHARLQMEVEKIQQLETKIKSELENLNSKISTMKTELEKYNDLNGLKRGAEEKKNLLMEEKKALLEKKTGMKTDVQQLSKSYEELKHNLEENETHTQLGNLERKWQHLEQNNFFMKDFISQKTAESDYEVTKEAVTTLVYQINQHIIEALNKQGGV